METCTSCHVSVDSQDRFCKNCGTSLAVKPEGRFRPLLPSSAGEIDALRRSLSPIFKAGFLFSVGLLVVVLIIRTVLDFLSG